MKEKMNEEKEISGRKKRWRDLHPSATMTLRSAAKTTFIPQPRCLHHFLMRLWAGIRILGIRFVLLARILCGVYIGSYNRCIRF